MKAAARRSLNCIRKTFCGTLVSVALPKFCEQTASSHKILTQNFTEIGQLAAELWPNNN